MTAPFLSVVIPVKDEQENIGPMLKALYPHLPEATEILIVAYDFYTDRTWRGIPDIERYRFHIRFPLSLPLRAGVAAQLMTGFREARGEAILVSMADSSDDPEDVPWMQNRMITEQADMVCASRYMKGGRQIGAPRVKSWLSWLAGWSLHALSLPTHDPSNSYKLYRASKLKALDLSGSLGFDVNLAIMDAAIRQDWRITEVPTTWRGRQHGDSSFRFWRWLPFYAAWWCRIAWRLLWRKHGTAH